MNTENIIITVMSTVFGGALASFLTYKISNRKQDKDDFVAIAQEYKEMLLNYKTELNEHKKKFKELENTVKTLEKLVHKKEKEIEQVRNQLMIFESSHSDVPIPIWLKDTSGKMLFINSEYERAVLHPINKQAKDYIGKFDTDVWGEKIGKPFQQHDKKVMRTRLRVECNERWIGGNGQIIEGRVIKYPRFLGRTVIGIGGAIIEKWEVDKNGKRI